MQPDLFSLLRVSEDAEQVQVKCVGDPRIRSGGFARGRWYVENVFIWFDFNRNHRGQRSILTANSVGKDCFVFDRTG